MSKEYSKVNVNNKEMIEIKEIVENKVFTTIEDIDRQLMQLENEVTKIKEMRELALAAIKKV